MHLPAGAVLYGCRPDLISARKSKYSYGMRIAAPFTDDAPPASKFWNETEKGFYTNRCAYAKIGLSCLWQGWGKVFSRSAADHGRLGVLETAASAQVAESDFMTCTSHVPASCLFQGGQTCPAISCILQQVIRCMYRTLHTADCGRLLMLTYALRL